MIHIATIHWKTDKWIDIQLKYLKKNIHEDFRVYAFLNDIDIKHYNKFYYYSNENIRDHGKKLNLLAEKIFDSANNENDLIFFIDGDAFPIKEFIPFVNEKLKEYDLVAVQQKENLGDVYPHPSFCATTIDLWKKIKGDWTRGDVIRMSNGLTVTNRKGEHFTDVGGKLYKKMLDNNVKWFPLKRTNKKDLHPVLFGIYGDIIYHHGAGFRDPITQKEWEQEGVFSEIRKIRDTSNYIFRFFARIRFFVFVFIVKKIRFLSIRKNNEIISSQVYNSILENEYFFKEFV